MQHDPSLDPSLSSFRDALTGPLGPTTLAFALSKSYPAIEALRRTGCSWKQIECVLNTHLKDAGRSPISLATIRGMTARHRRMRPDQCEPSTLAKTSTESAVLQTTGAPKASVPPANSHQADLSQESGEQSSDILSEAARLAALLKDLGD